MDSATVGPGELEQVIEVVGDAQQFLFAVVRRGDGVHQQMSLRRRTDDVAVAVGAVPEHRTGHVGPVAVKVFRIVAARAQTEGGAGGDGRWEGQNTGDMVSEIRVHVGIVDAVVEAGVGHGDDDAAAVQSRPRCIDVGHVGRVPRVVNVHHFDADRVHDLKERTRLHPFHFVLLNQPREVVGRERHGGKPPAVGIQRDAVPLAQPFGQCFAGEDHVHHGPLLVDEGVGGDHVQAEQASSEVGLDLVRCVHGSQAHDVELSQSGGRRQRHVAVETGRWHERETVDASLGKVVEPIAGHREGMTEDVETLHLLLPGLGRPFTWRNERHVSVEKVRDARCLTGVNPAVLGLCGGSEVELLEEFKRSIGLILRLILGRLSKRSGRKNVDEEESDEQERCSAALPLHALSTWGNLIKDWLRRQVSCPHGEGSRVSVLGRGT